VLGLVLLLVRLFKENDDMAIDFRNYLGRRGQKQWYEAGETEGPMENLGKLGIGGIAPPSTADTVPSALSNIINIQNREKGLVQTNNFAGYVPSRYQGISYDPTKFPKGIPSFSTTLPENISPFPQREEPKSVETLLQGLATVGDVLRKSQGEESNLLAQTRQQLEGTREKRYQNAIQQYYRENPEEYMKMMYPITPLQKEELALKSRALTQQGVISPYQQEQLKLEREKFRGSQIPKSNELSKMARLEGLMKAFDMATNDKEREILWNEINIMLMNPLTGGVSREGSPIPPADTGMERSRRIIEKYPLSKVETELLAQTGQPAVTQNGDDDITEAYNYLTIERGYSDEDAREIIRQEQGVGGR